LASPSPSPQGAASWTIPPARLHAEADWYYQDGKRREKLGDEAGAAQDYILALKLVPDSSSCRRALDHIRKEGLAATPRAFIRLATTEPVRSRFSERSLFAALTRALYGSANDRSRADSAFTSMLGQDDVRIVWRVYPVRGANGDQVWDSLLKESAALTNSPDVGITKWVYQWKTVPEVDPHGRQVFNALITSQITITMPQWKPSGPVSPDLRARWQAFYSALTYHEQGHQLIAEFTLAVLRLRIDENNRKPFPEPISDVCSRVMQDYALLNDQYDQATQHGALQGAVFRY
jgi:predicted secreted Zn-dependent protease